MVAVALGGEDNPLEHVFINVTRLQQRPQHWSVWSARLGLGDYLMVFEIVSWWLVVCAIVCSVTLAHTLIENMAVLVNVTDKCLFPALRTDPFATFGQTVLMLYHR